METGRGEQDGAAANPRSQRPGRGEADGESPSPRRCRRRDDPHYLSWRFLNDVLQQPPRNAHVSERRRSTPLLLSRLLVSLSVSAAGSRCLRPAVSTSTYRPPYPPPPLLDSRLTDSVLPSRYACFPPLCAVSRNLSGRTSARWQEGSTSQPWRTFTADDERSVTRALWTKARLWSWRLEGGAAKIESPVSNGRWRVGSVVSCKAVARCSARRRRRPPR